MEEMSKPAKPSYPVNMPIMTSASFGNQAELMMMFGNLAARHDQLDNDVSGINIDQHTITQIGQHNVIVADLQTISLAIMAFGGMKHLRPAVRILHPHVVDQLEWNAKPIPDDMMKHPWENEVNDDSTPDDPEDDIPMNSNVVGGGDPDHDPLMQQSSDSQSSEQPDGQPKGQE